MLDPGARGLELRLRVVRMREPRRVVLDEEVLVEAAAGARREEVREVEHAGSDVLEVGLVGSVAPHVVLDVVGEVPRRVVPEVLDTVGAALGDPEQVELELDVAAVVSAWRMS
jgi:hypothetical protein